MKLPPNLTWNFRLEFPRNGVSPSYQGSPMLARFECGLLNAKVELNFQYLDYIIPVFGSIFLLFSFFAVVVVVVVVVVAVVVVVWWVAAALCFSPPLLPFTLPFWTKGWAGPGKKWIPGYILFVWILFVHTQTCPPDLYTYKIHVRQSQSTAKNGNERSTSQPTSSDLSVGLWESSPNDLTFQDIWSFRSMNQIHLGIWTKS